MNLKKAKLALLTAMAVTGGTVFGGCSWADVQKQVWQGTLGFVNGYTAQAWYAAVPPPADYLGDLFGGDDAD
ncbi:unnamed protein product [marine sediment metagenome]|uniref:Lipoprotein n=1 Tax=marine sediment metagenome TaxID=412755 RepID=X0U250_9ZZZZ